MLVTGCRAAEPSGNPSFPLSRDAGAAVLADAAAHPKPLRRPVVIVGGYVDFLGAALLARDFAGYLHDDHVIAVSLATAGSFDDCRGRIVDAVEAAHPSAVPGQTVEVDVVGISMGGVAARYAAAAAAPGTRRLRIHALYTISSPHRGALLASSLPFDVGPLQRDQRLGSSFVRRLDADAADPYPVYAYVCLRDGTVGSANAAPYGQVPWWVPPIPAISPHISAFLDPRIRADIVRRLRGEPPLTTDPPTPLPLAPRTMQVVDVTIVDATGAVRHWVSGQGFRGH